MKSTPENVYRGLLVSKLNSFKKIIADIITRKAEIDEIGVNRIKECSEKGHIVYCSYQSSNLSLLFLYKLLKRNGLKPPKFALEYNPVLLQSIFYIFQRLRKRMNKVFLRKKYPEIFESDYIEKLLIEDKTVLFPLLSQRFFLRRYIETRYDSLVFFIELQKKLEKPIFLFPHIIFWNRNPERKSIFMWSKATGNPGLFRGLFASQTPSYVKITEPVNIKEIIDENPDETAYTLALKLREKLLDIYKNEKRVVLGPALRSRNEMMEKVLYHKNVLDTINNLSQDKPAKLKRNKQKAYRYYKEIAADFKIGYISFWKLVMGWVFKRIFSGIEYDAESLERVREASKKGCIVLVPCHRSHMDYIIISYMFYHNKIIPPHIAAGANLSFFPLGTIFRHSGAFFLRRSFKGLDLYPIVFRQYLKTIIQERYPVEYFIEGGRTRSGRLMRPKFGMTNFLLEAADEGYTDDLSFVPISINYDRVLEETSYVKELKGKSKKKESVGGLLKNLKVLKRDYGKVYVNVGEILTLNEISDSVKKEERSEHIGNEIIKRINRVVHVNPVALITSSMLVLSRKGFTRTKIENFTNEIFTFLEFKNVEFTDDVGSHEKIKKQVLRVIRMYIEDEIVEQVQFDEKSTVEELFTLKPENRSRISFYKNAITHHFIDISIISLAIFKCKAEETFTKANLKKNYEFILSILENEFTFEDEIYDFDVIYNRICEDYLTKNGVIQIDGAKFEIKKERYLLLRCYALFIADIIESYYIVFNFLKDFNKKSINSKELIIELRKFGIQLYHTDIVRAPESLSTPNYKSAILKADKLGVISEESKGRRNVVCKIKDKKIAAEISKELEKIINL